MFKKEKEVILQFSNSNPHPSTGGIFVTLLPKGVVKGVDFCQVLADTINTPRNHKNDQATHPLYLSPTQYKAPLVLVVRGGNTKNASKTTTKVVLTLKFKYLYSFSRISFEL